MKQENKHQEDFEEQNCSSSMRQVGKDVHQVSTAVLKENQESLTTRLWIPFALCFAYLYGLKIISSDWNEDKTVFNTCSIWVPIIGCVVYLIGVFLGKRFMKNREPFNLKNFMFTYNLYQTILNLWCVYGFLKELYDNNLSFWGNTYETTTYRMSFLIWIHYNNKYVELLDTAFMVLRKKDSQVSFLHVYHHTLVMWCWWCVCHFACWGDAYFGAMLNSFIHIVMYGYYLLALLNIPCPWKRYLTQMQLVQFVLFFANASYGVIRGHYPLYLCLLQIYAMITLFILFSNFYRQNYINRTRNAANNSNNKSVEKID
jgi:elongation of very long chain fatty acids protein 4